MNTEERNLPQLLRIGDVLKMLPISKSQWWKGVKDGTYPASIKLGRNITVWDAQDIYALIESFKSQKKKGRNDE